MRAQSAILPAVTTITATITVAAGVFAPGHLGELTWQVPFELADAVLEETRAAQRRLRVLPSRAGIYFVLALGLFPGLQGHAWYALRRLHDRLNSRHAKVTPRTGAGRNSPARAPGRDVAPGLRAVRVSKGTRTPVGGRPANLPAPAPADITHPACQRRGPTPGRRNRGCYALITDARTARH